MPIAQQMMSSKRRKCRGRRFQEGGTQFNNTHDDIVAQCTIYFMSLGATESHAKGSEVIELMEVKVLGINFIY